MPWPTSGPNYHPAKGAGHGGPAKGAGIDYGPAKGWSVEPPEIVSGERAPALVAKRAEKLRAWLFEQHPHLANPRYEPEVTYWAEAEARVRMIREYLDREGLVDKDGNLRERMLENLDKREITAANARKRLNIDAEEGEWRRAKNQATAAEAVIDLEQMADAGRAALESRRQRELDVQHEAD